jgi:hypothetical protein
MEGRRVLGLLQATKSKGRKNGQQNEYLMGEKKISALNNFFKILNQIK